MLKTILIDDEIDAIKYMEKLLEKYIPEIQVIGTAQTVDEGVRIIEEMKPELVFLDIEIPPKSGFDLLESVKERNFAVIFITAYDQYAIRAIKYSALDYLLKPVDIEDLKKAVKRLLEEKDNISNLDDKYKLLLENLTAKAPEKIIIPTSEGAEFVEIDVIVRVEGEGGYSTFFLNNNQRIVIAKNLIDVHRMLDVKQFYRVHKSNLINLDYVKKFVNNGRHVQMKDGSKIIVARERKVEFMDYMKGYFNRSMEE